MSRLYQLTDMEDTAIKLITDNLKMLNHNYNIIAKNNVLLEQSNKNLFNAIAVIDKKIDDIFILNNETNKNINKLETEVFGTDTIPALREEINNSKKRESHYNNYHKIIGGIIGFLLLILGAVFEDVRKSFAATPVKKETVIPDDEKLKVE